ncbi:hypothetical protein AVEN_4669-1 [Araneus ventricosus]|uniref:Uncharacterized protein n=1 Tax=Araneus ventricosus TaxID=182803 RepID=A0A4Y2I0R5_ARAVE|nr:hypothetical protein AVEN_4669-1 [Araneus ventricosus]
MIVAGGLLHNNVSPHATLCTQQLLQWFCWEVFDHSSYSPDLVSSDCPVFQRLKRPLAGHRFSSYSAIQTDSVTGWFRSLAADFFETFYRFWSHGITLASIPVVPVLRGS